MLFLTPFVGGLLSFRGGINFNKMALVLVFIVFFAQALLFYRQPFAPRVNEFFFGLIIFFLVSAVWKNVERFVSEIKSFLLKGSDSQLMAQAETIKGAKTVLTLIRWVGLAFAVILVLVSLYWLFLLQPGYAPMVEQYFFYYFAAGVLLPLPLKAAYFLFKSKRGP